MASAAVDAPGTRVRSVLLQPELVERESTARRGGGIGSITSLKEAR
jgi:hypothetical protein